MPLDIQLDLNDVLSLKAVKTLEDLASLLRVKYSTLVYLANSGRAASYSSFAVKKRSGGTRAIDSPRSYLKNVQRRLLEELETIYRVPTPVHGFVKGKNIVSNAAVHAGKRWVLNVDVADFFPSIHFGRVRGVLISQPYSLPGRVATMIARLCCYQDRLPQGAPTSPLLANIVSRSLDTQLRTLARKYRISYSRYADDITLSGYSRVPPAGVARPEGFGFLCGEELRSAIAAGGFAVNEEKFRVQVHGMRKSVTGLVVNRQVNVRRRFIRDVRAMINSWRTKGYAAAKSAFETRYWHGSTAFNATPPEFSRVLRGRLEHIRSIKGDTEVVYSLFTQLAALDQEPGLQRTVEAMRRSRESLVRRLERAVYVIESDNSCEQGTGFLIKGYGIGYLCSCL